MRATSLAAMEPTPAPLGRRTAAALIDLVLMIGLFLLFARLIGTWDLEAPRKRIALENWDFLLYVTVVLGYYLAAEALFARTIGKAVFGLRVVDLGGGPARPAQIFNRTLLRIIEFLPALYLVGFVAALANERNARLGDLTAKTAVVAR